MTVVHHTRVKPDDWPSIYFKPQEVACRGTGRVMLTDESRAALRKLDDLRRAMGHPLILNSAYRSPEHNKAVGGARNSYHMRGVAFDVRMDNTDPHRFEAEARRLGFTGIGIYAKSGFIHIDTRPGSWRGVQQGAEFPRRTVNRFAPERPNAPVADAAREIGVPAVGVGGSVAVLVEEIEPALREVAPNLPDRLQGIVFSVIAALALAGIAWRIWEKRRDRRAEGAEE